MVRKIVGSILAALVIGWTSLSGQAQAAGNRYAAITISNPTSETIHYQFRWGEDAEWQSFYLWPNHRRLHTYEYAYVNQNHSPVPYIRFDKIGGNGQFDEQVYRLAAYAVPWYQYEGSHRYYFRYYGRWYIDLLSSN